jgi:Domain of unknown function (DUF1992)
MTERKPPGVSFEAWADRQINEAIERGEFDNLPGAGKPIADLDKPYDEVWVMRHLRQEGVTTEDLLPTPLKLRKEIERLPELVRPMRSEQAVREVAEALNARIMAWLRLPSGPSVPVVPVDVDAVVEQWRADRAGLGEAGRRAPGLAARPAPRSAAPGSARLAESRPPWWRRLLGRRRTRTSG